MRNEKGGSSHDPSVNLPAPMWERGTEQINDLCELCRSHSIRERVNTHKHALRIDRGPAAGTWTMCPRCDGSFVR